MYTCFKCKAAFPSNPSLLKHIKIFHLHLLEYRCVEPNCLRIFSIFDSFKKHRSRDHNAQLPSSSKNLDIDVNVEIENENDNVEVLDEYNENSVFDTFEKSNDIPFTDTEVIRYGIPNGSNFAANVQNNSRNELNFNISNSGSICETFAKLLEHRSNQLASKLYGLSDLSRTRTEMIIQDQKAFVNDMCFNFLRDTVLSCLDQNSERKSDIEEMFKMLQNSFENFRSSYLSFKYFEDIGTFIKPVHLKIGFREEYKMNEGSLIIEKVPLTVELIPLRKVLKTFFELDDVLKDTLDYLDFLKNSDKVVCNYVQGDYWREFKKSNDQIVIIPIAIYFDDYENNNPLGSHRGIQKCGALYVTILCLPPLYRSKLANIFLFLLTNTLDRKTVGKQKIFESAINELSFLETTGIIINKNGESKRIYFKMVNVLGDNLGVNELFGLVQSFSANCFCRFCLIKKEDINKIVSEQFCTLRNRENYTAGLSLNQISITGIKEPCCFHNLPSFHFTENISVDIMHDFYEGICQYDLALMFNYFINKSSLTLEMLNTRIRGFCYSFYDRKNKPPGILDEHIRKKRIILTAAEMQSLIRNLPLMIGHLIPNNSDHWRLILKLKEISDIITADYYKNEHCDLLDCVITEYLTDLLTLFPNTLKPKHHFLLHYSRVMRSSGPLRYLSCMRGESKNKESKEFAAVAKNRINICYTIATKHQLKLNYYFQNFKKPLDYTVGPKEMNFCYADFITLFSELPFNEMLEIKWLKFKGQCIAKKSILVDQSKDGPLFYIVRHVFAEKNNKIIVITQEVFAFFEEHFHSFNVSGYSTKYQYFFWKQIQNFCVSHKLRAGNSQEYILKRWV